jgi:ATP-binding cassette subfamily C protein CydCD
VDRRLLRYARATAVALAAAVALGCLTATLAVAQAWLIATAVTAGFIDGAAVAGLWSTLLPLAAVLVARAGVAWAQESAARWCSAAVKSQLRMQLLRAAAMSGPGRETASSGEIVALATRGLDALDAYFARYLPQAVLAGIVPIVVIVCIATADLVSAGILLLTVPLIPFFMALIGSYTRKRRQRRWDALIRLSSHFLDVVSGLPTLRIFGRGEAQLVRLEKVTNDYRRESMATLRVAFLSAFALELAATLSVALVAVGVGLRLVDGTLDLRTGLFVLVLAPEAYLPLRQMGASFHASEEGLAAADSALRIIERDRTAAGRAGRGAVPAAPDDAAGLVPPGAPSTSIAASKPLPDMSAAEIRVDGVSVGHAGRALEAPFEASLVLRSGEVTGVAGPSGSGKSTLVDVILGLRQPDRGTVRIVGPERSVDLAAVDLDAWHRRVAWVPQHPYCFPGTVSENVRLGSPAATDADVDRVLAAVGLADLDPASPLTQGGAGVSSGQRRRIGVARALLRGGRVLILDEPTAGLDAASEATVLEAIRSAAREEGRAVLLVAHRPAALAGADRVVTVSARRIPTAATSAEAAGAGHPAPEPAAVPTTARTTAPSVERP